MAAKKTAVALNAKVKGKSSDDLKGMNYDSFWKSLIERFFYSLLKRALPELYEKADTKVKPRFLDKELRSILKTGKRKNRKNPHYADFVVEVPLKNGDNTWIVFHIEIQQDSGGGNLAERMFHYQVIIYSLYRKNPVALAIIPSGQRKNQRYYYHSHFGTEISYRYNNLVLSNLDDKELKTSDNPIDLALYAAKCALKAKREIQKYKYLRTLIELLAERGWSDEDKDDLLLFLEWIIDLRDENLEEQYTQYRDQLNEEGKIVYIRPGEREEIEEIKQKAKKENAIEMARELLGFGVSPDIVAQSSRCLSIEEV